MSRWNDLAIKACDAGSTVDGEAEALADAVELRALCSPMCVYNATMLTSDLNEWDPPAAFIQNEDPVESAVEAAFDALQGRSEIYSQHGYPFQYGDQARTLQFVGGPSPIPYLFLLGLSYTDPTVNRTGKTGATIFEEIAFLGVRRLIGSPSEKLAIAVGGEFHLGSIAGGFADKINHIAKAIKEGRQYRAPPSGAKVGGGDRGVDLLIRRGFPDERGAQMLVFAACAAGENWFGKKHECDHIAWASELHFEEPLLSNHGMSKCFLIPRVVPRDRWGSVAKSGGMVIDRCRLAMLLSSADDAALKQCEVWLTKGELPIPKVEKPATS